jgi:3-dehydroquinate dehydratase-2
MSTRKPKTSADLRVLVLNGPNLNLLGSRQPEIYGKERLADIVARLSSRAKAAGCQLDSFQSNHEGALIDRIHASKSAHIDWIIANPGGFTHSSVALRDALSGVAIPFIEVHLSNIHAREPFRQHSYFSDIAAGTICGLGSRGYDLALDYILDMHGAQS